MFTQTNHPMHPQYVLGIGRLFFFESSCHALIYSTESSVYVQSSVTSNPARNSNSA